ncbi:MAG: NAD(P)-dependent oxidoreductase [Sandaracinaceae bacterium]|nr:NAD(P)-dependent oxidoreductase [Sandaracinaceae bacterium]
MRVLVTGATGFLGPHLLRALAERGHDLRVLARPSSDARALGGVEVVRASFDDRAALEAAMRGAGAIVHAAGGGIATEVRAIYRANTGSTRALLRAAPSSLRRFVLVSSLAAHGPSLADRPAREIDRDEPRSHYGKSKLAAEGIALGHRPRFDVVILRPPALYGPGEHRMAPLFRAAARGFVPMVHPHGTLSLLHGADCARAIAIATDHPAARGTYYAAEPRAYGRREMAEHIGRALGRRVRVVPVAPAALSIAGVANEIAARWTGAEPLLTGDKARDAGEPHQACDPTRLTSELGWRCEHDFERGAREALASYRERGLVP